MSHPLDFVPYLWRRHTTMSHMLWPKTDGLTLTLVFVSADSFSAVTHRPGIADTAGKTHC